MQLEVTDNVYKRISQLAKSDDSIKNTLRISVDGGGCYGFMYKYEFVSDIENDDYIIEKEGMRIVVDPVSQQFMNGCVVDFIEQLGSSYFEVRNPSAAANCGCGNSFSI